MSDIILTSELIADYVQHMGDDNSIAFAAMVSTGNDRAALPENGGLDEKKKRGLINYLMKKRHGSPFEHNAMTFHVVAPIFVFREFQRHRIASYNEMSGRYKELPPRFYFYPEGRPLVQAGSSAHPDLQHGDEEVSKLVAEQTVRAYEVAWDAYQQMIEGGAALEVARAVLPVAIYSEMYVTMNARALMNFLSLRIDAGEASTYETKPQYEIQKVAEKMEESFAQHFPLTYEAFVKNGRVAP